MKFNKINDGEVHLEYTEKDLFSRHLSLRDLAYGSPAAQKLFQEALDLAEKEGCLYKHEGDIIRIEATPLAGNGLLLIMTRTDVPEELDARFARFSFYKGHDPVPIPIPDSRTIMKKIDERSEKRKELDRLNPVFSFRSMGDLIHLARVLKGTYLGKTALYRDPSSTTLYLLISLPKERDADFDRILGRVCEYGKAVSFLRHGPYAGEEPIPKDFRILIKDQALETLSRLP